MMFDFLLKTFIGLSFSGSLAIKYILWNNKHCKTRPLLKNINPLELKYYLFMITLDKCNGISNTLSELPGTIYVPNKTKDVNLEKIIKHISWKCKCKFDGKKCTSNRVWCNVKCRCGCKKSKKCVQKCWYLES